MIEGAEPIGYVAIAAVVLIIGWVIAKTIRENERNRIMQKAEDETQELSERATAIHEDMSDADEPTVNKWL